MAYTPNAYDRRVEAERYHKEKAREREIERAIRKGKLKRVTRVLKDGTAITCVVSTKKKEDK